MNIGLCLVCTGTDWSVSQGQGCGLKKFTTSVLQDNKGIKVNVGASYVVSHTMGTKIKTYTDRQHAKENNSDSRTNISQ